MRDVPATARWLGLAGLLPAFGCVAMAYIVPQDLQGSWIILGGLYAGLILSFLGGTWWGIAAVSPAAEGRGTLASIWFAAVTPSLIALGAGLWWIENPDQPQPALTVLAAGLFAALIVDVRLAKGLGIAPRWWLALRIPLSTGLGLATLALAFA